MVSPSLSKTKKKQYISLHIPYLTYNNPLIIIIKKVHNYIFDGVFFGTNQQSFLYY